MDASQSRYQGEIAADNTITSVKPPFKLQKDHERRYIRLQISGPVGLAILKDRAGNFYPGGDGASYRGHLLNLSAGGLLLETDTPLEEGTIVSMKMTLQEIEVLDNIIGIIKRAEAEGKGWLVGVEFVSREYLRDLLSKSELEILPRELAAFDEKVQHVVNKYVYRRKVSKGGK
jgi:PilZ domain